MIDADQNRFNEGLEQAKELFLAGDYPPTEAILTQLLLINNREAEIFQMLGTIYYDQGKFNKAIKTFRRALEIDPNYTDASVGLSIVLNDLGKYEEGKEVFQNAEQRLKLRQQKTDPYVEQKLGKKHAELGELYFQYKRFPEACEQYLKARNLLIDKEALTLRIVDCFVQNRQIESAMRELSTYLRSHPDSISCRLKFGHLLFQTDKTTEAVDQWENVLMRDPDNKSARKFLRMAHEAGLSFI